MSRSDASAVPGAEDTSPDEDGPPPDAAAAPFPRADSPSPESAAGQDAVRRLLSGRRDSRRWPKAFLVECRGIHGAVSGVTIDISRGGMLVELSLTWTEPPSHIDLLTLSTRVRGEFPDGMFVRFDDTSVIVRAQVVRIAFDGRTAPTPKVGCRFTVPLNQAQCAALGIPFEDRSPESPSDQS